MSVTPFAGTELVRVGQMVIADSTPVIGQHASCRLKQQEHPFALYRWKLLILSPYLAV